MLIQVKCDNCDWSMHPGDELRIDPDGDVTCVDCYAATLGLHKRETLDKFHSLPTIPPILVMEPGPPLPQRGEDAQFLVQWVDGAWSLLVWWGHKWSEIVSAKEVSYHVQLPGGQDE